MTINTSNPNVSISNRLRISDLKYAGLTRFTIVALCVPFLSFGQTSLKAQDADAWDRLADYYIKHVDVFQSVQRAELRELDRDLPCEGQDFGYIILDKDGKWLRRPTPLSSPQETIDRLTASLAKPDDMGNEDKATQLVLRGMMKSKLGDHQGAITDLNLALNVPGINNRIKAGILFNRGQVHDRLEQTQENKEQTSGETE